MSDNEPVKSDKKVQWIIGGLAILLVAAATYMNYGGGTHHGSVPELTTVKVASIAVGQ